MHGLPEFLLMMLTIPIGVGFVAQLLVRRRRLLVAVLVGAAPALFFMLMAAEFIVDNPAWLGVYAIAFAPSLIGSLIGTGLAALVTAARTKLQR